MLVTFRSKAGGSITMFGEHALRLLDMMGASGRVPGAFVAADVPAALRSLQTNLQNQAQDPATSTQPINQQHSQEDLDELEQRVPNVSLATRAAPLIDLLQRAVAAKAELLWDKTS